MSGPARFYRDVAVAEFPSPPLGERAGPSPRRSGFGRAGGVWGYAILLDGKPAKTPLGAILALPTQALAEAVADEWRAQGEKIRPATMKLSRLANIAIDRTATDRRETETQILAFAKSDLLCYRADAPAGLVARQCEVWDPLLEWMGRVHGARFETGTGIAYVEQPQDAIRALGRNLASRGEFELAGVLAAAALCGSAILALALADGRLEAEAAFAVSRLDAIFQSERWGKDAQAEAMFVNEQAELVETARFLRLLRA